MKPTMAHAPETAGSIMSTDIPVHLPTDTCGAVITQLARDIEWDDVHHIYIIDESRKLIGYVPLAAIVRAGGQTPLKKFVRSFPEAIRASADQEEAVFMAVKNDLDAIPVVDDDHRLQGAVTAKSILDVMHTEHIEDVLFATGIRRGGDMNFVKLTSARLMPVLRTRAPWLIAGAFVGVTLGLLLSQFEESLERTIALAYFVPVIAYIANSVGTQSEAIAVRALATIKLKYTTYIAREIAVGFILGIILGLMGAFSALIISGALNIAIVVGISLLIACTLANTLAAAIPIIFKLLGKDPALGSGPIAAALQDILSILVYFTCALFIIGA